MGDNPKERGKYNRISKHKDKTINQPAKSKRKPKLESNWDRYQTEEEPPKISSSTDFAILASAPITQGSHFQFKSDKAVIDEGDSAFELFNLDLELLSRSLMTIEFSVRSGIDGNLFTSTQRKVMEKVSQPDQYLAYLQNNGINSRVNPIFYQDEEEISDNSKGIELNENNETINDSHHVTEPQKPHEDDDLEKWLDDILDD